MTYLEITIESMYVSSDQSSASVHTSLEGPIHGSYLPQPTPGQGAPTLSD